MAQVGGSKQKKAEEQNEKKSRGGKPRFRVSGVGEGGSIRFFFSHWRVRRRLIRLRPIPRPLEEAVTGPDPISAGGGPNSLIRETVVQRERRAGFSSSFSAGYLFRENNRGPIGRVHCSIDRGCGNDGGLVLRVERSVTRTSPRRPPSDVTRGVRISSHPAFLRDFLFSVMLDVILPSLPFDAARRSMPDKCGAIGRGSRGRRCLGRPWFPPGRCHLPFLLAVCLKGLM